MARSLKGVIKMALYTGCIKKVSSWEQGLRISVMSRHTLIDGETPDPEIIEGKNYIWWWPELGPPATLIGSYYKRGLSWEEFEKRYREHLQKPESISKINQLIEIARLQSAIVLCVEPTSEFCHRRLLAEECKKLAPDLEVYIE